MLLISTSEESNPYFSYVLTVRMELKMSKYVTILEFSGTRKQGEALFTGRKYVPSTDFFLQCINIFGISICKQAFTLVRLLLCQHVWRYTGDLEGRIVPFVQ